MPSGRPDWFGTIVSAGKYDSEYIPIAVDEDGVLLALMKGAFDSVLKTIAVDTNGIMKANLFVQDLEELITRPKYGAANRGTFSGTADANAEKTLVTVSGKGMIYGGGVYAAGTANCHKNPYYLKIDDTAITADSFDSLFIKGATIPGGEPIWVRFYDTENKVFWGGITFGLTFETSVVISYKEQSGETPTLAVDLVYALI